MNPCSHPNSSPFAITPPPLPHNHARYDTNGEVLADTDGNQNWNETYIHFGGQLIAQYRGSWTGFLQEDHLGSTRLDTVYVPSGVTPPSGCTVPPGATYCVYDNMDYLPFGEQIAGGSATTHKFTGKERDSESGLDNFGARYNSSSLGRFLSPDWSASPEAVPYAVLDNPQSLNLYTYVKDNPLSATDLDGHCTKDGVEHGKIWCFFHYSDQDAIREAQNFFHNNDVRDANGNRINPDKLTDQQLLKAWKDFNDEWQAAVARGENPANAMAGVFTQWGWRGQADYNKAKNLLNEINTSEGTVDRRELLGKTPTKEEALQMIKDAGGKVERIEEQGHAAGGVSTHQNPHINYTTASGAKGTIDIKP